MHIRIKELREKHGLSQKQVAEYLHISAKLYAAYETGKKQFPVQLLSELSKKYHTSIDYLIGDTDMFTPHKKND